MQKARMERIFASAFALFSEHGIDAVAMTDVAERAEIGVASLYRYFSTKDELAIQTATYAWREQKTSLIPEDAAFYEKTGYEQLEFILHIFSEFYETHNDFTRFISFFDAYVMANHISKERLNAYEAEICGARDFVTEAIDEGMIQLIPDGRVIFGILTVIGLITVGGRIISPLPVIAHRTHLCLQNCRTRRMKNSSMFVGLTALSLLFYPFITKLNARFGKKKLVAAAFFGFLLTFGFTGICGPKLGIFGICPQAMVAAGCCLIGGLLMCMYNEKKVLSSIESN